MTKKEVIAALCNQPRSQSDIGLRLSAELSAPPFLVSDIYSPMICNGVTFYLDENWRSVAFSSDKRVDLTPHATRLVRRFDLLVSDFDNLLVAQSRQAKRDGAGQWEFAQLDEPCDSKLDEIAKVIAQKLGLRYVDAFALHAMSLEFEELPKHNEFEFVARLDYSEPNAFSLLFYEWA